MIKTRNGDAFTGIFFGASLEINDSAYLMKMVQRVMSAGKSEVNGVKADAEAFVGVGVDHAMSFDIKDVCVLTIDGLETGPQEKLQNGK
jgi:hypothetical protein